MAVRKEKFEDDDRRTKHEREESNTTIQKGTFSDYDRDPALSKKRSRITIDVSPELRRKIRIAAAISDLSISEYLGNILEGIVSDEATSMDEMVPAQEEQPLPDDFLEQVYQIREQVIKESKGEHFEDSTELIRKMREERTKYLLGEE
jgi:hypothetical protein